MDRFIAPHATWRIFAEGEHCTDAKEGDLLLVAHTGLLPFLIRLGQRISFWRQRSLGRKQFAKEFCAFNHAAVIVSGGVDAELVEMAARGGQAVKLSTYSARRYAVISVEATPAERMNAVRMANWCRNAEYGWWSIVGICVEILTPISLAIGSKNRLICSAATSLSARCLGLVPDKADASGVMPADLARYFKVS